jgi:hypothetical protein
MNNRSILGKLLIAAAVLIGAAVIGIAAYDAGLARGIAESGRAVASAPPGTPFVYVWPRPRGLGFFPVFPLVFFLLFFFAIRGLLWHGPWRQRGGWGCRPYDVPPAFDEWHRRAHGHPSPPAPPSGTAI